MTRKQILNAEIMRPTGVSLNPLNSLDTERSIRIELDNLRGTFAGTRKGFCFEGYLCSAKGDAVLKDTITCTKGILFSDALLQVEKGILEAAKKQLT